MAANPSRPIVGYRSWDVRRGGILRSLQWHGRNGLVWENPSGVARTFCVHTGRVTLCTIGTGCPCGLYALHSPPANWWGMRSQLIRGAIVAWGRVIVHETGFRAEHARVIGFVEDDMAPGWHRDAADRYNVPLLPIDELAAYAAWHGQPL